MQSVRRFAVPLVVLLAGSTLILNAPPSASSPAKARVIAGLPSPRMAEWSPGVPGGPLSGVPVENFGVVSPGCLYRSAQPGESDFAWLAQQGFRSVINLRKERDYADDEAFRRQGLNYLHLSIPDYHAPTGDQGRAFLVFMRDAANWPALVHCKGGQGRAGVMSALARYAIEGWPMDRALHEAKRYRPLHFKIYGEQRRWLNRWKDRFPAGSYHPSRPLPAWPAASITLKSPLPAPLSGS